MEHGRRAHASTFLREVSGSNKVRSSFRQHGRCFEKNGLAPAKYLYEMTLSAPAEGILPGQREGQARRSAGLYRHAASGVAGAQGLHGL